MPETNVTTAITAATPITTPSSVSTERSLFTHSDCSAIRMASATRMDCRPRQICSAGALPPDKSTSNRNLVSSAEPPDFWGRQRLAPILRSVVDVQDFDRFSFHRVEHYVGQRNNRKFSCASVVAGSTLIGRCLQRMDSLVDCAYRWFSEMRVVLL